MNIVDLTPAYSCADAKYFSRLVIEVVTQTTLAGAISRFLIRTISEEKMVLSEVVTNKVVSS